MSPDEYKSLALRTEYTPRFIDWRALPEVGEHQDAVKKHLIYGKQLDRVNVLEELGDIAWYMNLALDAIGFTWSDMFERNIAKLQKRYPNKFTSEAALNRDEAAERAALEDLEFDPGSVVGRAIDPIND